MAQFPLIRYREVEVSQFPTTAPVITATVVVVGNADAGPLTPTLLTSPSDVEQFIYKTETESVRLARELLQLGARVLFIRTVHPEITLSSSAVGPPVGPA